jgi:hypothetical protein
MGLGGLWLDKLDSSMGLTGLPAQWAQQACQINALPEPRAQQLGGCGTLTIGVMPAPVPSAWADKANNNNSIGIDDVTPVAASKPRKARNGHCRAPVRGPRTMTHSLVRTSKATTPPGSMLRAQGRHRPSRRRPTATSWGLGG